MGEDIMAVRTFVHSLKTILLENNNIDILLYLAKYNPSVTKKEIVDHFGKESLNGLEDLKKIDLVKETNNNIILTQLGIFQIDGLLTIIP